MRTGTIGEENSPIAVIDAFMPEPEAVRQIVPELDWSVRGDFYPGPRALVDSQYLAYLNKVLGLILPRIFGPVRSARVLRCYYALATTRPEDLTLPQRMPHVDSYNPRQIALVHYLCPEEFGGTAFYRHRATGFETIDEGRAAAYQQSIQTSLARGGAPPSDYIGNENNDFEQIGRCTAAFNRAVLFPGNLLHCADLAGVNLPADPIAGRLTATAFIQLN